MISNKHRLKLCDIDVHQLHSFSSGPYGWTIVPTFLIVKCDNVIKFWPMEIQGCDIIISKPSPINASLFLLLRLQAGC